MYKNGDKFLARLRGRPLINSLIYTLNVSQLTAWHYYDGVNHLGTLGKIDMGIKQEIGKN